MRSAHSSPGKFPRFTPLPHDCTQLFRLSVARHKKAVFRCEVNSSPNLFLLKYPVTAPSAKGEPAGFSLPWFGQKKENACSAGPKRSHAEACAPAASFFVKCMRKTLPWPSAAYDGGSSSAMQGRGRSRRIWGTLLPARFDPSFGLRVLLPPANAAPTCSLWLGFSTLVPAPFMIHVPFCLLLQKVHAFFSAIGLCIRGLAFWNRPRIGCNMPIRFLCAASANCCAWGGAA